LHRLQPSITNRVALETAGAACFIRRNNRAISMPLLSDA
jgi:hypothetical protein